jgi:NADH dehydrogenase [ubiquinone] 1 alpha subcomplex assembly factor 1
MFILRVILIFSMINNSLVFDFKKESNISNWVILDDVVMGGKSYGNFYLNKNGHGEFYGDVSLENNGGFSSVRYRFNKEKTNVFSKFIIRVKGDGKAYQFRVKNSRNDYHSYIYSFQTTKDWQTIEIPFAEMYPAFRGRKLNIENYQGEKMQEIAFLIGNKKNENFRLEIDKIEIQ